MRNIIFLLLIINQLNGMEKWMPEFFGAVRIASWLKQQWSQEEFNKKSEAGNVFAVFAKVIDFIEEKKLHEASDWYTRFVRRVDLDEIWLSSTQQDILYKIKVGLDVQIIRLNDSNLETPLSREEVLLKYEKADRWLFTIINKDICDGIEWREWLHKSEYKNFLQPQTLKTVRLDWFNRDKNIVVNNMISHVT